MVGNASEFCVAKKARSQDLCVGNCIVCVAGGAAICLTQGEGGESHARLSMLLNLQPLFAIATNK